MGAAWHKFSIFLLQAPVIVCTKVLLPCSNDETFHHHFFIVQFKSWWLKRQNMKESITGIYSLEMKESGHGPCEGIFPDPLRFTKVFHRIAEW